MSEGELERRKWELPHNREFLRCFGDGPMACDYCGVVEELKCCSKCKVS
jgi:Cys-tRNA synthase (O-phospho-L-seryl-tRNA:Cys-tRNA synthase)